MKSSWKKLSTEILHRNNWWSYFVDRFNGVGNDNLKTREYHYVHTNGSSLLIPVNNDGKIILVKQYRYLNKKFSIEFPCGGVKDDHTFIETADLELQEETKFKSGQLTKIGEFNPFNGVTDEICNVFMATKLSDSFLESDDTEELEVHFYYPDEINQLISSGEIWDGMTIAAWQLYKCYSDSK